MKVIYRLKGFNNLLYVTCDSVLYSKYFEQYDIWLDQKCLLSIKVDSIDCIAFVGD